MMNESPLHESEQRRTEARAVQAASTVSQDYRVTPIRPAPSLVASPSGLWTVLTGQNPSRREDTLGRIDALRARLAARGVTSDSVAAVRESRDS